MPFHPKIALSSATVAPASAARVAAIFRQPCAERLNNPAPRHASLNALPNDSLVSGLPFLPQINASSPVGPASSVRCSQDRYRDNHLALTLLGAQCGDVITDMLTTEHDRIRRGAARCRTTHRARLVPWRQSAIACHKRQHPPRSTPGSPDPFCASGSSRR